MPEAIVVSVVALLAAALVFFKARERLRAPGARRSRHDDGASAPTSGHDTRDGDAGDGGGGD